MQNPLRDRLESAALRLDEFLDSSAATSLGRHEHMLLALANDIAQAIDMVEGE